MRNLHKIVGVFLLGVALTFNAACSKDDDGPGDQLGKAGTLSMNIDGKPWQAEVATIMTLGDTVDEGEEKSYYITINGVKVINGSDEESESISLSLLLTDAGFNNPKRSYPIASMSEADYGYGVIMYNNEAENDTEGGGTYVSINPEDTDLSVGNLTVKDYEIGNQSFFGQLLGKGYTKLSGTFEAELYSYDGTDNPPKKIAITEGKFNVNSDLLSGFGG